MPPNHQTRVYYNVKEDDMQDKTSIWLILELRCRQTCKMCDDRWKVIWLHGMRTQRHFLYYSKISHIMDFVCLCRPVLVIIVLSTFAFCVVATAVYIIYTTVCVRHFVRIYRITYCLKKNFLSLKDDEKERVLHAYLYMWYVMTVLTVARTREKKKEHKQWNADHLRAYKLCSKKKYE